MWNMEFLHTDFSLFICRFDWYFTRNSRKFHLYDGGQHYWVSKSGNAPGESYLEVA